MLLFVIIIIIIIIESFNVAQIIIAVFPGLCIISNCMSCVGFMLWWSLLDIRKGIQLIKVQLQWFLTGHFQTNVVFR